MKTIQKLFAVIGMMAAVLTSTINADVVAVSSSGGGGSYPVPECNPVIPDRLPISDATDIQAYAWDQLSQIGMWGWAESAINSSTNLKSGVWIDYPRTNGVVDVEEVFGIIKAQQLLLSVLYPSDKISLQVGLYSKDANLFYSYSSGPITSPENGVSKNTLDVVLEMSSEISFPFVGAQWFEIVERDGNGNPIRYYSSRDYDVQNGNLRFPAYFAKKNGEIRVAFCDGTEVAYSLNGGKKIIPTAVEIGVGKVSAFGTRTFRNTNAVYLEVSKEESDKNVNPLSQFTTEGGEIKFAAWRPVVSDKQSTAQAEIATAVLIWHQGQPSSTALRVEIGSPNYIAIVPLNNGRYWVKFEWSSGWPFGNQFSPPYQYYGEQ